MFHHNGNSSVDSRQDDSDPVARFPRQERSSTASLAGWGPRGWAALLWVGTWHLPHGLRSRLHLPHWQVGLRTPQAACGHHCSQSSPPDQTEAPGARDLGRGF